eukprot:PhM_4_TR2448/c3_g1_i2/m.79190
MAAIHAHPKRKSNDPDGLKAEHLAMLSQRAMDILCEIMTDSLRTGAVPSSWRTARARPTYKTGKPATHINSYRPVAITSIICRTLERITLRRLEESLQVHTHNRQFGFRRAHSCEQLLRTLQLDLAPTATKQEVSLITAFDMSDAFCKVHRDIVANRLVDALHVQHSFARWVHAFMTGRTFSVYEGMYTGPPVAQHHGVPQGSVLGPFLWNVFVNPLFQALDQQAKSVSAPMILRSKIRVYGYADDMTTMISMARTPFCTPKSITQVGNAVVSTFNSWCQVHGVTLSPKSHSILVGEGLHWAAKTLTLESGGVRVLCLEEGQTLRILGLHFDNNLSFVQHANHLLQRLEADRQDLLARGLCFPIPLLKTAIKARSLSRITYGMDTYYPLLPKQHRQMLQAALARCCQAILGTHSASSHLSNIFECGISSLDDIHRRLDFRRRLEATALPKPYPFSEALPAPAEVSLQPLPMFLPYSPAGLQTDGITFYYDHHVKAEAPAACRRASSLALLAKTPTPTIEAWTDGSLQEVDGVRCTGAAATLWRGTEIVSKVHSGHRGNSSFIAEHKALTLCLSELGRHVLPTDHVRIITDSLANIKMLSRGPLRQDEPQGMEIWRQLLLINARSVTFVFVFGHCGLERGDDIDLDAKRAAKTVSVHDELRHNFRDLAKCMTPDTAGQDTGYRSRFVDGPDRNTPALPKRDLRLLYSLRTGACKELGAHHVTNQPEPCPMCGELVLQRHSDTHPVDHLFQCPKAQHGNRRMTPHDLWRNPVECIKFVKTNLNIEI